MFSSLIKFLGLPNTKQRKIFYGKENVEKGVGRWRMEQKTKRRLFDCSRHGDLESPWENWGQQLNKI